MASLPQKQGNGWSRTGLFLRIYMSTIIAYIYLPTISFELQDWSRTTGALTRSVCVHGMTLAARAVSSRTDFDFDDQEPAIFIGYVCKPSDWILMIIIINVKHTLKWSRHLCRRKKIQVLKEVISRVNRGQVYIYIIFIPLNSTSARCSWRPTWSSFGEKPRDHCPALWGWMGFGISSLHTCKV